MGYYILQRPGPVPRKETDASAQDVSSLRAQLEDGNDAARREALRGLIARRAEKVLSECLAEGRPGVIPLALAGLWECWMNEAGPEARLRMEHGIEAMNAGDLAAASQTFKGLMTDYPDWAEAINKEATAMYLQGRLPESIELCHRVVAMKPDHFGAWNGMAICAIQTENWSLAFEAVQESLRLQPHSQMNHQLLRLVESRLPQV